MWKSGDFRLWTCVVGCAAGALIGAAPQTEGDYRAAVEQFAHAPSDAITRMLAMPADAVAESVRQATRTGTDWKADELDRALLMHGDAAITLSLAHSPDADRQVAMAGEIAAAAAGLAGNEWFVHRWYKAFTARVSAPTLADRWRQQPWYRVASGIDRGRVLEASAAGYGARLDTTVFEPSEFVEATSLFERGLAAHLTVAAVHLGHIQMLRGNDREAKRLFELAAGDKGSRVNRYLGELFLGSMLERDDTLIAERHYRAALAALPHAQSGRFALAALLASTGRDAGARRSVDTAGAPPSFDPWWSYFHFTARDHALVFAELHSEVCQ